MIENIKSSLIEAQNAVNQLILNDEMLDRMQRAGHILISALEKGNCVFSCGNGGSMCDAMHFAEELTGRYRKNRKGYPAVAISDPGHITCVANDFGFDQIFSRYLESHGKKGDCLVALSTSGKSNNIVKAVNTAKSMEISTIALTGKPGTVLEDISDICIITPGGSYADRVQELHIKVLHIIIEIIERYFHPNNYSS